MPAVVTRALGGIAALAGMTVFACQFAMPIELADGSSIVLSETTATYRNVGIGIQALLLAALGLAAALRPAVGARVLALGGFALPWLAGSIDLLWRDAQPGVVRALAAAVMVGVVAVGLAAVLGVREVRWSSGGILLGDGIALLVAAGVLWGLLGANWYRLKDLDRDLITPSRFGSLLASPTGEGTETWVWVAAGVAVLAVVVATVGGGWGRRVAGAVVTGVFALEVLRRVFLSGERLITSADRAALGGDALSGEPVLGMLVIPLVGMAAGAWFLTTAGEAPVDEPVGDEDGDGQRLAARNPSDSATDSDG